MDNIQIVGGLCTGNDLIVKKSRREQRIAKSGVSLICLLCEVIKHAIFSHEKVIPTLEPINWSQLNE